MAIVSSKIEQFLKVLEWEAESLKIMIELSQF